jgi:DNA-directed RNA polymerase I and III subunit RPAC1
MAIEKVFILNNTGVMDDGILAHRLGLIPLKVDPREFQHKTLEDDATDLNTLVFKLNVACKHTQKSKSGSAAAAGNSTLNSDSHLAVKSNNLEWLAQGDQEERFPQGIRPVHEDILITKLRPGQAIELEMHCEKGIGKDHAKFSPVGKKTTIKLFTIFPSLKSIFQIPTATASYRILPEISILKPITGENAVKFQQCFPPGVIDVVESNKGKRMEIFFVFDAFIPFFYSHTRPVFRSRKRGHCQKPSKRYRQSGSIAPPRVC